MDDEFDPSLAPLPEGVLPDVQKLLRDLIDTDMDQAVDYLKRDPIAVLALSILLRALSFDISVKKDCMLDNAMSKFFVVSVMFSLMLVLMYFSCSQIIWE